MANIYIDEVRSLQPTFLPNCDVVVWVVEKSHNCDVVVLVMKKKIMRSM